MGGHGSTRERALSGNAAPLPANTCPQSPCITRRQLGGAPPFRSAPNPAPFPTIPLPADRTAWPELTHTVLARAVTAARVDNCIPHTRVIIDTYGGSGVLLTPLFHAHATAVNGPVALERALGGTLRALRLAYAISGIGRKAAEHPIRLPIALSAITWLRSSGLIREQCIAVCLADTLVEAFGEDVHPQMTSATFDPLRSTVVTSRLRVQMTRDPHTVDFITKIQ